MHITNLKISFFFVASFFVVFGGCAEEKINERDREAPLEINSQTSESLLHGAPRPTPYPSPTPSAGNDNPEGPGDGLPKPSPMPCPGCRDWDIGGICSLGYSEGVIPAGESCGCEDIGKITHRDTYYQVGEAGSGKIGSNPLRDAKSIFDAARSGLKDVNVYMGGCNSENSCKKMLTKVLKYSGDAPVIGVPIQIVTDIKDIFAAQDPGVQKELQCYMWGIEFAKFKRHQVAEMTLQCMDGAVVNLDGSVQCVKNTVVVKDCRESRTTSASVNLVSRIEGCTYKIWESNPSPAGTHQGYATSACEDQHEPRAAFSSLTELGQWGGYGGYGYSYSVQTTCGVAKRFKSSCRTVYFHGAGYPWIQSPIGSKEDKVSLIREAIAGANESCPKAANELVWEDDNLDPAPGPAKTPQQHLDDAKKRNSTPTPMPTPMPTPTPTP